MYYYLNSKKTPTGPHSIEELCALLQQGAITLETLVAPVGGDAWKPLGTILTDASAAGEDLPPVPGIKGEVACPYCGQEFTTERKGLPEQCPHCGTTLHAQSGGLWRNFALAFRRILQVHGRSTRKEYWSTLLIFLLISFLLVIGLVITLALLVGNNGLELSTAIMTGMVAYLVLTLFSTVLSFLLQVRRLHDVGWSGWWVAACMALSIGVGIATGAYANLWELATLPQWKYSANTPCVRERAEKMALEPLAPGEEPCTPRQLIQAALMTEYSDALSAYQARSIENQHHMGPWVGLAALVSYPLVILIFVLSLLDSKRGSNKYGPSAKYPLG